MFNINKVSHRLPVLAPLILLGFLATACGGKPTREQCERLKKAYKAGEISQDDLHKHSDIVAQCRAYEDEDKKHPQTSNSPSSTPAPGESCHVDHFQQTGSEGASARKLDVLFVMSHSESLEDDWQNVANKLERFVRELPPNADVRYGVLLGDVGKNRGHLYAPAGMPSVLDNQKESTRQLSSDLKKIFSSALRLSDEGGGRAIFHSLYFAVTKNARDNQKLGFFRPDAGLSIIFLSDENEAGARFPSHSELRDQGLPFRHDEAFEENFKGRYYKRMGIDTDTTFAAVKALKGDMPVSTHAFLNLSRSDFSIHRGHHPSCQNDALGYGFFEMVGKTSGVLHSLSGDCDEGMGRIGRTTCQTLKIQNDFKLSWAAAYVDPSSIVAKVDGTIVPENYSALTDIVHLSNAGSASSKIEISYCQPRAPAAWNIAGFAGEGSVGAVILVWQTPGALTSGKILFGTSPTALNQEIDDNNASALHNLTVTGLAANTTYYFQLVAQDQNQGTVPSQVIDVATVALPTATQTNTLTATTTQTVTQPQTATQTVTASSTQTITATASSTQTVTATASSTQTVTQSQTATQTVTQSQTATVTATATVTNSATASATSSTTSSTTSSATSSATASQSNTATATATATGTTSSTNTAVTVANWQLSGFDGTTTGTTASLIWQTPGAATTAVVSVGLSASDLSFQTVQVPTANTSQVITVTGLSLNTTYFFQVTAKDSLGNTVTSAIISKKTKAQ